SLACRARGQSRPLARPCLWHQDDAKAVRVLEGLAVLRPIRVCRRDGSLFETRCDLVNRRLVAQVEHEQGLRVGSGRRMRSNRSELDVSPASRDREKDALVAVVIVEAADLVQSDPVTVEGDDLLETLGVPGDAELHGSALAPHLRALLQLDLRLLEV